METIIGVVFPYLSALLFLIGCIYRVGGWMTRPRKLDWRLHPIPTGMIHEAKTMVGEWVSFRMLWKNNRAIWFGSYAFHLSLVALAGWLILFLLGLSFPWLLRIGLALLAASCIYLLAVRALVGRIRFLSTLTEYLNLCLFGLFSALGLAMLGTGIGPQGREHLIGLICFNPSPPPKNALYLLMLLLFEIIVAYFPYGKMFHVASKYFAFHKLRWAKPELSSGKAPS